MLVLSRMVGEILVVGDLIRVKVLKLERDPDLVWIEVTGSEHQPELDDDRVCKIESVEKATAIVRLCVDGTVRFGAVEVTFVHMIGGTSSDFKARIGIDAPRDLCIHRKEVYDALHQERSRIAGDSTSPSVDQE